MSDRQTDVLASIDAELTKCICGQPVPANGPSLDYCSPTCQYRYATGTGPATPDHIHNTTTDGRAINSEAARHLAMPGPSLQEEPGHDAMRQRPDHPLASVETTTRVMWHPGPVEPGMDLSAGVDLTPYLTRLDLGPTDARSTT